MTSEQMIAMVQTMTTETDTTLISNYLNIAGQKIINKAYPFTSAVTEVPAKYQMVQCEIAAYLVNKRGAEGEMIHVENGIHRHYQNADVPDDLFRTIIPFCGIPMENE